VIRLNLPQSVLAPEWPLGVQGDSLAAFLPCDDVRSAIRCFCFEHECPTLGGCARNVCGDSLNMVTRVGADCRVLKWARERIKLSAERAASLLKCRIDALRKIESGELFPGVTLFRRMAHVYLLPEATLLGLTSVESPLPRDFRSFDGAPVSLSYETVIAIRRVEARQEALVHLSQVDESIVPPNLPIHTLKDDPEKLANALRQQLGFSIVEQLA